MKQFVTDSKENNDNDVCLWLNIPLEKNKFLEGSFYVLILESKIFGSLNILMLYVDLLC